MIFPGTECVLTVLTSVSCSILTALYDQIGGCVIIFRMHPPIEWFLASFTIYKPTRKFSEAHFDIHDNFDLSGYAWGVNIVNTSEFRECYMYPIFVNSYGLSCRLLCCDSSIQGSSKFSNFKCIQWNCSRKVLAYIWRHRYKTCLYIATVAEGFGAVVRGEY